LTIYHTPGVYFERRDITPPAIGIPRSDIAGFAGIAMRGPLFEPVKIESWKQFVSRFGDFIPQAYLAYAVYGFFSNGGRTCWVSRVADVRSAKTAREEFGDVVIAAQSPGTWGNQIYVEPFLSGNSVVALLLRYPDGSEQFLRAPFQTEPVARDNLFGLPQNTLDNRSDVDSLVDITTLPLPNSLPEAGFLSGGADGLADLKPEHFEEAFENLGKICEIGVMVAPDLMPKLPIDLKVKKPIINCCSCNASGPPPKPQTPAEFPPVFTDDQIKDLQVSLTAHAESTRYRFAILDVGGERSTPDQALRWRRDFPNSSFSGLYYPWILVDDPLRLTGLLRVIPPSGHIAGIFARSDQRKGVHKPPMNEVVEGVSDVRFPVEDVDHGELNDNNVNVVRVMPGRGVRLMGARTLWRDILLRYVNVRRLLSTIEKGLEQSLNWTVFEPNNPQLWAEIDRIVRSFLETLFRLGMLDGGTSEEAYSVRCDESTNPASETDLGRVTCEVGVQPPYPAEFVVVTLGISRDGIQVREGREQNA
jgi:hypothetical protein